MVIGFDALPEALAKIRSGDQTATIEQSPGKQIRAAMKIIVDHLRKKTPLHDEVIKPFLVDKTDLDKAERIGERSRGGRAADLCRLPDRYCAGFR